MELTFTLITLIMTRECIYAPCRILDVYDARALPIASLCMN